MNEDTPDTSNVLSSEHDVLLRLNAIVPQFVVKVDKFTGSRQQLKAVLAAIILSPMTEIPLLTYPEQKELYEMGMDIQSLKLMLLYMGFKKQENENGK